MKVLNINFLNNSKLSAKKNLKTNNYQNNQTSNSIDSKNQKYLTTSQYLSFCAGYSLNLSRIYSELKPSEYPADIQNAVFCELEANNPDNKALCDIHYEKYKGVLDCYSLDELKEKFSEFSGVKPALSIAATPESFIGRYQNGESKIFNKDEDLTLQLIKLYWGHGFSLEGLSKYIEQNSDDEHCVQLLYTFRKLNIPVMNGRYSRVLKLSNKKYNEEFLSELGRKIKEAKEAKIQAQEGEPVYIPRGEMPESQKRHISESLKKYYKEHPEKLFDMSKRQKEFFAGNKEAKEEMRRVMLFAWHKTQEGQSVLKHLNKFMRKNKVELSQDELSNPYSLKGEKKTLLDQFWMRNTWAREKFSIAVKKGYEDTRAPKKLTALEQAGYIAQEGKVTLFRCLPAKFYKELNAWVKEKGYDPNDYAFGMGAISPDSDSFADIETLKKIDKKSNDMLKKFLEEKPQYQTMLANSFEYTLVDIMWALLKKQKYNLPKSLRQDSAKADTLALMLTIFTKDRPLYGVHNGQIIYPSGIEQQYLNEVHRFLIQNAMSLGCEDVIDYFQKKLDEWFEAQEKSANTKS